MVAALVPTGGPASADSSGGVTPVLSTAAATLETAWDTTCVISDAAELRCWGSNFNGQLGQGDIVDRGSQSSHMGSNLPPINLGTGRTARSVAIGSGSVCAVLDDGGVKCWGRNDHGQLGLGDTASRGDGPGEMGDNLPAVDLGAGRTAVAVSVGLATTCAVLDDGSVKCWGENSSGQLGLGDTADRGDGPGEMGDNLPRVDLGFGMSATAVTVGAAHVCALLGDGSVKCWGGNAAGQLGLGDTADRGDGPSEMGGNLPEVDLGTNRSAVAISAGFTNTCAVLDDGSVKCWGSNSSGELGLGDTTPRGGSSGQMGDNLPPIDLGTGRTAVAVTADNVSCAVLDDGGVKCWGRNDNGQLGLGDTADRGDGPGEMGDNLPEVDLGLGERADAVSAGTFGVCARLLTDTVKCWGSNGSGQLGLGDTADRGDDPDEMGEFLAYVDVPTTAPAWIACNSHRPVGYWLVETDGTAYEFGDARALNPAIVPLEDAVDIEATPTGCGYWMLFANGFVFNLGDAPALGDFDLSSLVAGEKLSSFSPTPSGRGLWGFTDRGRVLTLGDAKPKFAGGISDLTSINLAGPIIDSVPTPSGEGYYMLGSDGGVFAFGDATFVDSLPGIGVTPDQPTVGLVPDPDEYGYWMVAADGGVFAFAAPFVGSLPGLGITQLQAPVIGMTPYADGYLQVASDGGVFNFSSQPFSGSLGANPPNTPIVALTPLWKGN